MHVLPSGYPFQFLIIWFNDTTSPKISTLSLHDALPICRGLDRAPAPGRHRGRPAGRARDGARRSEEHTSELQSLRHLVCRLLLEKKKCTEGMLTALDRFNRAVASTTPSDSANSQKTSRL